MADGFDFNDKLLAATLTPLAIVALLVLVRFTGYLIYGGRVLDGVAVKYMLLMLYFGIATIATIVTKTFECTEFDALDDQGKPTVERFLTAVSRGVQRRGGGEKLGGWGGSSTVLTARPPTRT